jgi:hypothetical protein
VGAGAVGDVSEDLGPVLELNPVDAVGKRLHHDPLHEWGALGHERRLYQTRSEAQPRAPFVSTTGPFSVIATVCSKYAERAPSAVQIVQPSGFM